MTSGRQVAPLFSMVKVSKKQTTNLALGGESAARFRIQPYLQSLTWSSSIPIFGCGKRDSFEPLTSVKDLVKEHMDHEHK